MNWAGNELSKEALKNRILSTEEVEEAVATDSDKLFDFQVKWEGLKALLKW